MARYGSPPMGQALTGMTATILNEMGHAPTVSELCAATGLPKSSISRYISAQMQQGIVREAIDPQDRRRRMLLPTEEGQKERAWQIAQMREILQEVRAWDEAQAADAQEIDGGKELERMMKVAANPPEEFKMRRKRGRPPAD